MTTQVKPRPAAQVMRLDRLGSSHQHRLSFMRVLLRRIKSEAWTFTRTAFKINDNGVGHAVYTVNTGSRDYSLVAFAHDLPAHMRSDRVIATAWDATFTLFDGIPTDADIERLGANIPLQEAGRVSDKELSVSRANRSVRLWQHVVDRLASGLQPDPDLVFQVGYLMRTTAVYGSGKLGAADREWTENRAEFVAPFQIEMLSVWLTRAFVMDLVEHMARAKGGDKAIVLDPAMRRRFGIGNSTGLGMAPYLINHPLLLNNWIAAREEAIARVRNVEHATDGEIETFKEMLRRAGLSVAEWHSEHPIQVEKLASLRADVAEMTSHLASADLKAPRPWDALWRWAERALSLEGQELLTSLMMEPYGHLVDGLSDCMCANEAIGTRIDGAMKIGELRLLVEKNYGWALATDWTEPASQARCWYTSEEKLEPRLGERFEEPIAEFEQPLCPGRDISRAYLDTVELPDEMSVADFVLQFPQHRHAVRRAQIVARFPYAEIYDNTISDKVMAIDLLRAKLAFFGALHFDPRSDRWVRINMYRGAPFPHELSTMDPDNWGYPQ